VKRFAVLLCLVLAGAGVQAQTVYRCGPDGRVYSQTPCPQGRAVDVSDKRSDEQRAIAQARTRDDQVLGDALERERLDREAGKPATAGKIDGRPAPPEPAAIPSKAPKKKKSSKAKQKGEHRSDDFKAVTPPKKKPRRAA
jgi:hypothetical protein